MADKPEHSDVEMGEDTPSSSPKGKGRAPEKEQESADEESEEEDAGDEVMEEDVEEEDDMAEIDTTNIVSGRRSRKPVDYAKAAADAGKELEPDEDDDEDFVSKGDEQ